MQNKIPSYDDLMIEVCNKNVNVYYHPTIDGLVGFNYLDSVTYDKKWNNVNIWARGILFYNKICIAVPFTKFFNIEELNDDFMDKEILFAQEKEDGSLIISFVIGGEVHFATRGSFISEQAKIAKKIWNDRHNGFVDLEYLEKNTMLFELVGPSNINICKKHKQDELILLSTINIQTGIELDQFDSDILSDAIGCKRPVMYSIKSAKEIYNKIKEDKNPNFEGIVITLKDGYKAKIKSIKYFELSKSVSRLNSTSYIYEIWEDYELSGSIDFEKFFIPDEFYPDVIQKVTDISFAFNKQASIWDNSYNFLLALKKSGKERKDISIENPDLRWMLTDLFSGNEKISNDKYIKNFKKSI